MYRHKYDRVYLKMIVCIIHSLLQYLGVLETIERFGMETLEVNCMFQNGENVIKF